MTTTTTPSYLIFAGDIYYPAGGMKDLYSTAVTLEEATLIATEAVEVGSRQRGSWWKNPEETNNSYRCDWAQIVDLKTMKIIADITGEEQPKVEEDDIQDLSYPPLKEDGEYDYEVDNRKMTARFEWHYTMG
jgi:hypothetical protein